MLDYSIKLVKVSRFIGLVERHPNHLCVHHYLMYHFNEVRCLFELIKIMCICMRDTQTDKTDKRWYSLSIFKYWSIKDVYCICSISRLSYWYIFHVWPSGVDINNSDQLYDIRIRTQVNVVINNSFKIARISNILILFHWYRSACILNLFIEQFPLKFELVVGIILIMNTILNGSWATF